MLTYISLFSGAGGFSIGFNALGYRCLFANDIDEDAEKTHNLNFPKTPFIRRDILNYYHLKYLKPQKELNQM